MANTTDKSILTAAGKALLAQLNAEEKPLIIDKMIFANVPSRPEFPQPDDVVPNDHVVHQEGVEQRGRLSADSVIYSTTLTSDVGPFEFNWTGAYCSEYGVLVTIDHHALTPKSADEPGVAGNTLVRSVVLEYKDIAEITNITVDASSWQYNATPRMKKMDDDVAQAIIDQNGKDWFIEDGFLVTPQASAFNIKAGAGYVSGNRVTLEFDRNVQVPNKPSFIYIDAHREGTPTGEQVTLFDFVVTAEEKDDYTDANGVKHFVCKIAQVLEDGSVSDLRPEGESASRAWVSGQIPLEKFPVIGEAKRSSTERFEEKCNAKDFLIPAATPADAIQLAFDKASIKNYPGGDTGGHTYTSAYKEVLIPAGEWIISKKISLPAYWSVDARGAFLKPADGFADYMFEGDGWQARWKGGVIASNPENGEYSGKGIKINNKNKDQGNVNIKDVQFKGLYAGADVECQSTKFVFEDCSWDNCKHFVIQRKCDVVEIRGGWGTQGNLDVDGSGSFEVEAGTLLFHNFLGVPRPASGKETAWINFAGSRLVVQGNSRFGGEGGSKTLVNWRTKYDETYTYFPVGMTIKNNHLFMVDGDVGNETKSPSCVVRLFEVPNHIHINNNAGMVDTRYLIAWARSVDTSAQRADLLAKMEKDLWEENVAINLDVHSKLFDFDVTGNQGHFAGMANDWSYIEYSELFHDVFNGIPVQKPLYDKATFFNPSGKRFTKCDYALDDGHLVLKLPAKWTDDANGYQVVIDTRPNVPGNVNYRYAQKAYCSIYTGYDGSEIKSRVMTDNRLPVGIPPGFQTPAIASIEAGYWTRDGSYSFGDDFAPGIGDKCLAVRIPINTGYDVSDLTFVSVRAM
ncbi:phage tail-collar fiber domain-containing protein [Vibrio parahaemolyticus]|uniref:phage tail-collar fiber domain-containing protein n=1 Tax=Vibrio parahaemolyticus TaxID=670 RepID=UPI000AA0A13E|nr:phage tail protein [Vibrio parahaemolyticus]